MLTLHRRTRPDWTAADFDSFEVLVLLGAPRPAARVNRARASRPVRRAVRAVLRQAVRVLPAAAPARVTAQPLTVQAATPLGASTTPKETVR